MKTFVKLLAILALLAIGFGPLLTGLADIFWWIFTSHTLSGLDWRDGGRYFGAVFWTLFIGSAAGAGVAAIVEV